MENTEKTSIFEKNDINALLTFCINKKILFGIPGEMLFMANIESGREDCWYQMDWNAVVDEASSIYDSGISCVTNCLDVIKEHGYSNEFPLYYKLLLALKEDEFKHKMQTKSDDSESPVALVIFRKSDLDFEDERRVILCPNKTSASAALRKTYETELISVDDSEVDFDGTFCDSEYGQILWSDGERTVFFITPDVSNVTE